MNNGGYQPFMFGGSYGPAGAPGSAPNNSANNQYTPQPTRRDLYDINQFAGQATRRDNYNVRDCMFWPASIQSSNGGSSQKQQVTTQNTPAPASMPCFGHHHCPAVATVTQPFNRGDQAFQTSSMVGGMSSSDQYVFHAGYNGTPGMGEPQTPLQYPQGHVKAYISTPGEGGAPTQPIQIPCHLGGPGQIPVVPPQAPLAYKVTVPITEPSPPLDFEVKQ